MEGSFPDHLPLLGRLRGAETVRATTVRGDTRIDVVARGGDDEQGAALTDLLAVRLMSAVHATLPELVRDLGPRAEAKMELRMGGDSAARIRVRVTLVSQSAESHGPPAPPPSVMTTNLPLVSPPAPPAGPAAHRPRPTQASPDDGSAVLAPPVPLPAVPAPPVPLPPSPGAAAEVVLSPGHKLIVRHRVPLGTPPDEVERRVAELAGLEAFDGVDKRAIASYAEAWLQNPGWGSRDHEAPRGRGRGRGRGTKH